MIPKGLVASRFLRARLNTCVRVRGLLRIGYSTYYGDKGCESLSVLQQAYRDDLERRIEDSERNEHVQAPGLLDPDQLVGIISERKILHAMEIGSFDKLSNAGKPLDPNRPVGAILTTSNSLLPWVEKLRELDCRIELARKNGTGSDEIFELNNMIRACNNISPPQFQRAILPLDWR